MKKLIIIPIFFCLLFTFQSEAQQFWLQKGGGATIDEGTDISTDGAGNSYATGYFTGGATFGSFNLTSAGVEDIYLAQMSPAGVYNWAVRAGGSQSDRPMCIKTDPSGNSYITGFFYGTATFGTHSITSAGLQDVFIAKYDNTGNCLWAKSAGGSESDIGNGITVDGSGNVIVTGQFAGTATFGSTVLTSMNNSADVFTTKLDNNGNFLWAKKGSGPLIDKGVDVACDGSGNIYIAGMFNDTITFDVTHNNNMANAIFVVKYNSSGAEQWFCRAGGGISNEVSGIAIDPSGNPIITGTFQGPLSIFSTSGLSTLTNTYSDRIFAIKFNGSSGALAWSTANGSNSAVVANNIAVDASGNSYIIGNFECKMNQYADQYGQGTFNSVGYWDIFVTMLNSSGVWQWSRQAGGHNNESGNGIAVSSSSDIFITGSFNQDIIFPSEINSFLGYNTTPITGCTLSYCNDSHYGEYERLVTSGNSDAFIAKDIDLNRQPYDFYNRTGSGCSRPALSVCINNTDDPLDCMDSVKFCSGGDLYAITRICASIAPTFTYHWSNGGGAQSQYVSTTGNYRVTLTSTDECLTSSDTIYVKINPPPPVPTITDSRGVNTNAISTQPIVFCAPGTVLLTGGDYGNNTIGWTGPNSSSSTNTILATVSGNYIFVVTDSNGCIRSNYVQVQIDSGFANTAPKMICIDPTLVNDTVSFCTGNTFTMFVYDTISNPSAHDTCPPWSTVHWSSNPNNTITFSPTTICPNACKDIFTPTASGWYTITASWVRMNICDTDTVVCSKTIYVNLYPLPILPSYNMVMVGGHLLCPSGGDTIWLKVSGNTPRFTWSTGATTDSIYVTTAGTYSCFYDTSATNSFGCNASSGVTASITVTIKPQPDITMGPSSGVICPGDSVQLTTTDSGTFLWQGPNGPVGGNNNPIYVTQPGSYYCTLTDTQNCVLVSNTVTVTQYTTPYLISTNTVFCAGDTVTISVSSNANSTLQWQPPLSGSSPTQHVTTAGTYTCDITSCGITTPASIVITQASPIATIDSSGPLNFCVGDSVILTGNPGMVSYLWNPTGVSFPSITVKQTGTIILTTTDSSGCTAKDTINIVVTPAYTAPSLAINPDTVFCPGDTITITAVTDSHSIIQWYSPLSGSSFTQKISTTGTYVCSITYCHITTEDSIKLRMSIPVANITPLGPLTFCGGDSLILDANTGMSVYTWFPDSIHQTSIKVFTSGTYTLKTADSIGCKAKDTIVVNVIPNNAPIRPDTTICNGASITLVASGTQTIEWYTSDTSNTFFFTGTSYTTPVLTTSVTYYIMSNSGVCRSKLTPVTINIEECYLFVPNVFSPNGDGKNDIWTIDAKGFKDLKVKIYNRWGMLVYNWTGTLGGWNGEVLNTGMLAPDGVYFWVGEMTDLFDNYSRKCGTIELIKN